MQINLNEALEYISDNETIFFTYHTKSSDFTSNNIEYISFVFDIRDKEDKVLILPSSKKQNSYVLRVLRKSLFEIARKTIISFNIKDFLNFIPGNFKSKSKLYDLQLIFSIENNHRNLKKPKTTQELVKFFGDFLKNRKEESFNFYKKVLEPSIYMYSDIEKFGLPTKYGIRLNSYYNLVGTVSGRLTNSSFDNKRFLNPLNLSKENRGVIKEKEGRGLILADYNAMEMRVLSYLAQDEKMIEIFEKDNDFYEWIGRNIFNIEDVQPHMRKLIKDLCFLIVYGGTEYGFSKQQNCSVEFAKNMIDKFFSYFENTEAWILQNQISLLENAYVKSIFGRKRFFDFSEEHEEICLRQGQNFLVQSAANDITLCAMLDIYNSLLSDSYIVAHIHDAIIISTPISKRRANEEIVYNCMKNPSKIKDFNINSLCLNPVLEFNSMWR